MAVIIDPNRDFRNCGEKGLFLSWACIVNPKGITRAERTRAGKWRR
jgi:hypothetical protein